MGALAVSRALGDFEFKGVEKYDVDKQMVSPEPEFLEFPRSEVDFILMACDGVWDVRSSA